MFEDIVDIFFRAASMQRWNDHIRPANFTELDKQAHKIIIAYFLANMEESENDIDWRKLIDHFLFEFFYRSVLTDIKPPVFHKMMEEKQDQLNQYVIKNLEPVFSGLKNTQFFDDFKVYVGSPKASVEDEIIEAAHYLATNWEFKIIYHNSPDTYGIEDTRRSLENRVKDYYNLKGVTDLVLHDGYRGFIDLCSQLRFQKRWAHTPRIPETSVLGHMLTVGAISYFLSQEIISDPCDVRLVNTFFAGLFHDLAEVLTKDITSPIKKSVEGLDDIIKDYERDQFEKIIVPLIPSLWLDDFVYLVYDEFDNKVRVDGCVLNPSFDELNLKYNNNGFCPVDGELLDVADKLSAFCEAVYSTHHGLKFKIMVDAACDIRETYKDKVLGDFQVSVLYDLLEKSIKKQ